MTEPRHAWSLAEIGGVFAWAESGALTPEELRRAAALAPLAPSPAHWRQAADRLLAFAGIVLLAVGLVFFFAYNWDDLHRYAKLGLAWSAMAAAVAVAMFAQPLSLTYRAALLGAAIATGVLLALIGQTYQTGADLWELFAAWLLMITPFALLARSSASWLLWVVIANLALGRYLSTSSWFVWLGLLSGPEALCLIAGANLLVLFGFEAFSARLLVLPRRLVQRLLALGVIAPLAVGAGIAWWDADYFVLTPVFFLLGGVGFWYYRDRCRDVPILAMITFSAIAVLSLGLAKWLPGDFFAYNLVALFVIACTGYAAVWLMRLVKGAP